MTIESQIRDAGSPEFNSLPPRFDESNKAQLRRLVQEGLESGPGRELTPEFVSALRQRVLPNEASN